MSLRTVIGFWLMLCPFISAEAAFSLASTNRVGLHPVSIAALSVHGNTNQDLVIANGNEFTLTVLTNVGGATFGSNATINLFGAPTSVVTGYFHNTNSYDIATCQYGTNIISVFTNAAGVYGLAETLPTGVQPMCLTVADINQDGHPDLICANGAANNVMIFTNDGAGNLVFAENITTDLDPVYVTTADMNLDSYPDILTANELGNSVTVLMNDTTGNFPLSLSFAAGNGPTSLTTFDLNGDGYPDVVVADAGTNTLSVLTNDHTGSLVYMTNIVVNPHPGSIVSVGSGTTAILACTVRTNRLTILTNNFSGYFSVFTNLTTGLFPGFMLMTDVNRDGQGDLVIANGGTNTFTVFTNIQTLAYPPLIPKMTTNTAPSGFVLASSNDGTNFPYYAFDSNNITAWQPSVTDLLNNITYQFPTNHTAYQASLLGTDAGDHISTIRGSFDNTNWYTLYVVPFYNSMNGQIVNLTNVNNYIYYQFNYGFIAIGGVPGALATFQLYGY